MAPKKELADYPLLLSVHELAQITGFSPHTIRDWCEQDLLPAKKIGNRWRLERECAIVALKNLNRRRRRKVRGQKPAKTGPRGTGDPVQAS